jgi:tetratricopeptide (TPR) repeat protein
MRLSDLVSSLLGATLVVLVAAAPGVGHAAGSAPPEGSTRATDALDPARKAIEAKDWDGAVRLLSREKERQPMNADVYNLLGYAERQRGNLEAAFAWYDKALALDPKHLGAHEYVGEAWLKAGNLAKAEEHLAALDKLCPFSCSEVRDLKRAVARFRKERGL